MGKEEQRIEGEGMEAVDETEDVSEELDALVAVAQLDLEAAGAYEIAAKSVDDARLRNMLESFAKDHRRHVEAIQRLLEENEMEVEIVAPDPSRSALLALATALGSLDESAALEGLIANEHLTNRVYETASWLVTDEAAKQIVARNREDEQRHLTALLEYLGEMKE